MSGYKTHHIDPARMRGTGVKAGLFSAPNVGAAAASVASKKGPGKRPTFRSTITRL